MSNKKIEKSAIFDLLNVMIMTQIYKKIGT